METSQMSPHGQRSQSPLTYMYTEKRGILYGTHSLWHIVHLSVSVCVWLLSNVNPLFEAAMTSFLKGLAEVGTHEGVDYGINARVAVGHAVCPYLHFVCVIVLTEMWAKRLCQDEQLDGPPAQNKQLYNHQHHPGYFSSYSSAALCLNLELLSHRFTHKKDISHSWKTKKLVQMS